MKRILVAVLAMLCIVPAVQAQTDRATLTGTVKDTAGNGSTTKRTIDVAAPAASDLSVYAGYYDTHHPNNPQPKPSPWEGSANTQFVGIADSASGGWDSSAVRVQLRLGGADVGPLPRQRRRHAQLGHHQHPRHQRHGRAHPECRHVHGVKSRRVH